MQFTDRLDNPINVGDIIVFANVAGSGGNSIKFGRVEKLIELVPKAGIWLGRGGSIPYVREDRPHGAEYYPLEDTRRRPIPEKCYQAMVVPVRRDQHTHLWYETKDRRAAIAASEALVVTSLSEVKFT